MSLAARNAPLMLAVTMAALPGPPLVYAGLIIGMLVEFPHLTVPQRVLLGRRHRMQASGPSGAVRSQAVAQDDAGEGPCLHSRMQRLPTTGVPQPINPGMIE